MGLGQYNSLGEYCDLLCVSYISTSVRFISKWIQGILRRLCFIESPYGTQNTESGGSSKEGITYRCFATLHSGLLCINITDKERAGDRTE